MSRLRLITVFLFAVFMVLGVTAQLLQAGKTIGKDI